MSEYAGPGKRRHRTFEELKRDNPRWFVMTLRFVKATQSKYTDYGVEKVKKVTYTRPDREETVGKPGVVAKRGNENKVKPKGANKGLTEKQLDQSSREKGSTTHLEEAINLGITAPVKEELSLLQVQTVILQNLDVLGKIAKAKNAVDQFNALMIAIGAEDEVIVMDSITSPIAYSEAAVQ